MTHGIGLLCLCKQKTAYEMRISDWGSDVCASDLMSAWLSRLQGRLNATGLGRPRYRLEARAPVNDPPGALIVKQSHNGLESTQVLTATRFESGDLKALADWGRQWEGLLQHGDRVRRGTQGQGVERFSKAQGWWLGG